MSRGTYVRKHPVLHFKMKRAQDGISTYRHSRRLSRRVVLHTLSSQRKQRIMPSRKKKKAKGKARKVAKAAKEAKVAKAKEEESRAVVQDESLEAQMQRLTISAESPKLCKHGIPQLSPDEGKIFKDFLNEFFDAFLPEAEGDRIVWPSSSSIAAYYTATHQADVMDAFGAALIATRGEQYNEIYISKLDKVISFLLYNGTQFILDGNNSHAKLFASIACFFEDYMVVEGDGTKAIFRWAKINELLSADDHTLVQYYRKRIPCSCLDEKYKEVKSVKKMGLCYNPNCSQPGRRVERSKMFSCTRCGAVNYCSVECQKVNWKDHKETVCNDIVETKAALNSNRT